MHERELCLSFSLKAVFAVGGVEGKLCMHVYVLCTPGARIPDEIIEPTYRTDHRRRLSRKELENLPVLLLEHTHARTHARTHAHAGTREKVKKDLFKAAKPFKLSLCVYIRP